MLNLLPAEAQGHLHREYRLRLGTLALLFFTFAVGTGIVSMIPFALSFGSGLIFAEQSATTATSTPPANQQILNQLQSFKDVLTILDPNKVPAQRSYADSIKSATLDRSPGITLTSFSFVPQGTKGMQLVLSGVSATREALVSFSNTLSADPVFSAVNLPISNLSKKSAIEFSLTVLVNFSSTTPKQ